MPQMRSQAPIYHSLKETLTEADKKRAMCMRAEWMVWGGPNRYQLTGGNEHKKNKTGHSLNDQS